MSKLSRDDRERASGLFMSELRERQEPTSVFSALTKACEQKQAEIKSVSDLSDDEIAWLRGVLAESEKAVDAMKTVLGSSDDLKRRRVQTLKLKAKTRAARLKSWLY